MEGEGGDTREGSPICGGERGRSRQMSMRPITTLSHHQYRVTARISIPAPVPTPVWSDAEEDRPEVTLPPRKRLGIALGPRYEEERGVIRRERMLYGNTDSWDENIETLQGAPVSTRGDTSWVDILTAFED
ncbi:hypothetical protein Tco_1220115 [Tanacetum coccineum]